ncbi:MAG: hypothetical protein RIG77_22060 [Cyclobacteriaceae bacterium]
MKRRSFIGRTSVGLGAVLISPVIMSFQYPKRAKKGFKIKAYKPGRFLSPVQCVTPDDGFYLHTFYDVCPLSPSQRYLVVTKFPYQQKTPMWGDESEVCVIDLHNETIETVYKTKAWSFQLGTNVQWGSTDRYLYTNDIIDGKPVCIRIDLHSEEIKSYSGAKYDLSPDERYIVSPNLLTMNTHQYGYAVPDRIYGRPDVFTKDDMPNEGLWKTDLESNETTLLADFSQFHDKVEEQDERAFYEKNINYLFHSKINRQNTKIMQVFRAQVNNKGREASLFTMDTDGKNLIQCLTRNQWNQQARFGGAGNHPNWHPDGEHIVMNCVPTWLGYKDMLFCQFKFDGSDFRILSEQHLGTGHPSVNADSTYLLSDAYPHQKYIPSPKGELPIRLIDLKTDQEQMICSISTDVGNNWVRSVKGETGSHYKLDPHPVWSRDYKKVVFNGSPEGRRQVYIADLSSIV